jgi:hypothetical protein
MRMLSLQNKESELGELLENLQVCYPDANYKPAE